MTERQLIQHDRPVPQADLEATLQDVLVRFRESADQGTEQIERFARAGAEVILVQLQHRTWLSSSESAAPLGLSEVTVREHVQQHMLPALHGADQQPRIHRRDVSLYQLSQRLGATEDQRTVLMPPVAWNVEFDVDQWHAITPG